MQNYNEIPEPVLHIVRGFFHILRFVKTNGCRPLVCPASLTSEGWQPVGLFVFYYIFQFQPDKPSIGTIAPNEDKTLVLLI